MKPTFPRGLLLLAGLGLVACVGCSSKGIVKGTTPVTAIAPSHTFPYPVGPGDAQAPPKGKDVLKGIPIPTRPRR